MPQIGLRYPMYAPLVEDETAKTYSYGDGKVAAKAVSVNWNLNISDNKFYADDGISESEKVFESGTMTFTPDDLSLETKADWLGNELEEETVGEETIKVLKSKGTDSPGYFGFGFVIPKIKNKVRQYRAILFTKVQFGEPDETAETKGESINWQTPAIEGNVMRRIDEAWKEEITVTSLDTALAWLRGKLNVAVQSDSHLTALTIGDLTLDPEFSPAVTSYTADATAATSAVTAAAKTGAAIAIEVNDTPIANGGDATWDEGENTVEITVTYKTFTTVYTVTVTKST